jgi:hypothetical protein
MNLTGFAGTWNPEKVDIAIGIEIAIDILLAHKLDTDSDPDLDPENTISLND